MVAASMGEGLVVFPPQLFISTLWDGLLIRFTCSTPNRTSKTLGRALVSISSNYIGPVPEYLATAIHNWLQERKTVLENGGFCTLQAAKLTII
jgi:hypothetical protein